MTDGSVVRPRRALFVAAVLSGSFLLFLVQPMVARMALPRLGGAPAVWNSAMLVYQALLLGGYAYAHALGRLGPRAQGAAHLALLGVAALWLPIGLTGVAPPADGEPAIWVPWLLLLSIGPLFFAVSAQAPLLQRWFAAADERADPYPLYAASNLGSFAGLLAYPLLVEPRLTLRAQSLLWSAGYGLLALLVLACALALPRRAASLADRPAASPAPERRTVLRWIALAAVPSGLMLATSTFLTTDVVAGPLVWVLPLGLYLLSFTVAFAARRDIADVLTRIAPITVLLFGGVMIGGYTNMPYLSAAAALTLMFMAAVALHSALYDGRPAPDRLTGFYLATALGGALGGLFAALLAPVLFDWFYEYPLLILAAGALVPQLYLTARVKRWWTQRRAAAYAVAALVVAGLFLLRYAGPPGWWGESVPGPTFALIAVAGLFVVGEWPAYLLLLSSAILLFGGLRSLELSRDGARTRSYFGVYTVRDQRGARELDHGTTVHGVQLTGSPVRERTPTTYYARGSGVGQAMALAPALYGPNARVGVVGLGTGTLACYARAGQRWRFYEIDPAVVRIARDSGRFTFLARCLPDPAIRIGDARLSLAADPPASLDLLALDAFSSDAIPAHLLTREAFGVYGRVLSPRGLLLVHISNRFLDLEPVVAAAAREGGWRAALLDHRPSRLEAAGSASSWIALSRDPWSMAVLAGSGEGWRSVKRRPGFRPWTDDYNSVLPLVNALN